MFELLRLWFMKQEALQAMVLLFGMVTKLVSLSVTYPYRVFQTGMMDGLSFSQVFQKTYNQQGIRGFFAGYSLCVLRCVPPAGFMFLIIEFVKSFIIYNFALG